MFFTDRYKRRIQNLEQQILDLSKTVRELEYAVGVSYTKHSDFRADGQFNYSSRLEDPFRGLSVFPVNEVVVAILDHLNLVYKKEIPKACVTSKPKEKKV